MYEASWQTKANDENTQQQNNNQNDQTNRIAPQQRNGNNHQQTEQKEKAIAVKLEKMTIEANGSNEQNTNNYKTQHIDNNIKNKEHKNKQITKIAPHEDQQVCCRIIILLSTSFYL